MNYFFLILTISCHFLISATEQLDFHLFDCYQGHFTHDELQVRIKDYLEKDVEIENYFRLTETAFFLYPSSEAKKQNHPEFTLQLAKNPKPKLSINYLPRKNLKGIKIAIDPGHFGGEFARLEDRYIEMPTEAPFAFLETIYFDEGTLNLLTAKLLKHWLEQEGAEILLTKEKGGTGVYDKDFYSWMKDSHAPSTPLSTLFRTYNGLDLRARAHKINAFQPDITLIIHYNAHLDRDPITKLNVPANHNYNMAFVGGGFSKGELQDQQSRFEFTRLLLTNHIDQSIMLSQAILEKFTQNLQVPLVQESDGLPYLKRAALKISEGLYARNLALTRLIHSPLCYGETLCQDHFQEALSLNARDLSIDGLVGPKRVKQVARAYFEGVKAYFNLNP